MQERRKFLRYDIPLQIKFKTSKSEKRYSAGLTRNFSRQGLCFISEDIIPYSKCIFELSIKHPQENRHISVVGDVVWTKQVKPKCLVGIKLIEMDKEAKLDILDYAYDKWLERKE
jgi:c-di-GMP-binding flagellar brake protein YcgR